MPCPVPPPPTAPAVLAVLADAAAWADASRIAGGALQQRLRACWNDSRCSCGESDEFGTQVDASGKVLQQAEPSYAQCTHTSFFTECVTCVEDKCQVRTAPPCTAVRCCTHLRTRSAPVQLNTIRRFALDARRRRLDCFGAGSGTWRALASGEVLLLCSNGSSRRRATIGSSAGSRTRTARDSRTSRAATSSDPRQADGIGRQPRGSNELTARLGAHWSEKAPVQRRPQRS